MIISLQEFVVVYDFGPHVNWTKFQARPFVHPRQTNGISFRLQSVLSPTGIKTSRSPPYLEKCHVFIEDDR